MAMMMGLQVPPPSVEMKTTMLKRAEGLQGPPPPAKMKMAKGFGAWRRTEEERWSWEWASTDGHWSSEKQWREREVKEMGEEKTYRVWNTFIFSNEWTFQGFGVISMSWLPKSPTGNLSFLRRWIRTIWWQWWFIPRVVDAGIIPFNFRFSHSVRLGHGLYWLEIDELNCDSYNFNNRDGYT